MWGIDIKYMGRYHFEQSRAEQSRAEQSRAEQSRNTYLDLLRGLAALSVILFHYTTRYEQLFGHREAYRISFSHGGQAVALFFVLSGYFAITHVEKISAQQYAIKRFFRMYPVYWCAILITFPLSYFLLPTRSVTFREMAFNFTMFQGFFEIKNVDGAYWTLQHELNFYIIVGLILMLKWNKHIEKLCVAWIVARMTLIFLPDFLLFNYLRKVFRLITLGNGYGHMFISGVIIRCLENRVFKSTQTIGRRKWISILFGSLLICVWLQFYCHGISYGLRYLLFLALTMLAIFLTEKCILIPTNLIKLLKPILFISTISYPLYLIHQNIGYIIIQTIECNGLTSEIWVVVPIAVMILCAFILNKIIEQPCAKIAKKLCQKKG